MKEFIELVNQGKIQNVLLLDSGSKIPNHGLTQAIYGIKGF